MWALRSCSSASSSSKGPKAPHADADPRYAHTREYKVRYEYKPWGYDDWQKANAQAEDSDDTTELDDDDEFEFIFDDLGKTHYDTLGLRLSADRDEVKKAYQELAKKYHPDVCEEEDAAEKFQEIQKAYSVLKDRWQKAVYDKELQMRRAKTQASYHKEAWTAHWGKETEEEVEARRKRYKQNASSEETGEELGFMEKYHLRVFLGSIAIFLYCLMTFLIDIHYWFGHILTHGDDEDTIGGKTRHVRAMFNPVTNVWERLNEGEQPPTMVELLAAYVGDPRLFELSREQLPASVTVGNIPFTQVSRDASVVRSSQGKVLLQNIDALPAMSYAEFMRKFAEEADGQTAMDFVHEVLSSGRTLDESIMSKYREVVSAAAA